MSNNVTAIWVGPGDAILPDGTHLQPHVTKVQINASEAAESDNWQVVTNNSKDVKPKIKG